VATKRERQRKLAKEAHQRRLVREAERQKRARQWSVGAIAGVAVLAVVGGALALAGVFGSTPAKSVADAKPSVSATASPSPSASATTEPAMLDGKCIYTASGTASRKVHLPPATPDTKATYQATLVTNQGDVVIDLLNSSAPCTVNSFVSLADQDFFNKTPCFRLTDSTGQYILQCGDPTGSGYGGPGYEYASENLTGATYPAGTLAMANSGTPDSNGSQFFLVYQNSEYPPDYTPFGRIVSGLNILQNVGKHGFGPPLNSAGGGAPKEKVEIESVTIKQT
jgi:peptidyl-prolyl cis-trans isomerase B (cyclophilin B)